MRKLIQTGALALMGSMLLLQACKKDKPGSSGGGNDPAPTADTGTGTAFTTKATDPSTASTVGFFMDSWQGKTFTTATSTTLAGKPGTGDVGTVVTVDLNQVTTKVPQYMYGNNMNAYMGQLTDATMLNHITNLNPGILRAPGGSLSDIYFWNAADGKAPADAPTQLTDYQGTVSNAGFWYGKNTGSWTCSLDNYYAMLGKTNSTAILTVNYGYARYGTGPNPVQTAAHLAADWVRYDRGRTKYWEVGNENYGNWEAGYNIDQSKNKDGQPKYLTGDLYGQHFKVFADSMRKAAADVGAIIEIGAVMADAEYSTNPTIIKNWNRQVLSKAGNSPDFYIVHSYYTPYNTNASPEIILPTAVTESKAIADYIKASATAAGVTQKPIALTEWNINSIGSRQMVSNIAGLHAVMVLGEVIKNGFGMASRWDMANSWDAGNDHGLLNNPFATPEPNAAPWNPRPAFFYLYYFQKYFGDRMVPTLTQGNADVLSYGSTFNSGQAGVILVNKGTSAQTVAVKVNNYDIGNNYYYYTLNGGADNGSFSAQVMVNGQGPASGGTGGPVNYTGIVPYSAAVTGGIRVTVPAYGAVFMVVAKK
ncbi:alpha-L-arabinofuranosidase [Mucilaginibacter galii]|uniref:Alpha-L-arabinofuranosidase n=1 Tax=Mucilaginibacter galii TaxID=2005073 RepID=A0A917J6X5_9SPHI|nr:alpha-L-arabinofuranosidase [Mucilaginibacter galii]GGI48990.1 alpha-L-arabinofuranosidase [Mucilaginibacter galii]